MVFSISECAPYLSMTLFRVEGNRNESAESIKRAVQRVLKETSPRFQRQFRRLSIDVDVHADLGIELSAIHYSERRSPS